MKTNYDKLMMEEIDKLSGKKRLLMHSCCGPCSSACIERLKDYFDITIVYYNPNIEPKDEYLHRRCEQERLLREWNIDYLECDYDNEEFRNKTEYLAGEIEGGKRCSVCFGIRLKYTALKAKELGYDYFATTLTVSPHKNSQVINKIGEKIGEHVGVKYLYADFKKREGYKRSIELASKYDLYRQNYCGCLYSKEGNGYEE